MTELFCENSKRLKTITIFRISRPEVFCEKGVLRNFTKFTEKQLCQSLFLIGHGTGVFL